MNVQIHEARKSGFFRVSEIDENGHVVRRDRTLVVHFPKAIRGAVEVGSVWDVLGSTKLNTYKVKDREVKEDTIWATGASIRRMSGDLLAYYLSENVSGVGLTKALRLVRAFTDEQLAEIIRNKHVDEISKLQGFSQASAQGVIDAFPSDAMYEAIEFLDRANLPISIGKRLARVYGEKTVAKLSEDPFMLSAFGVSFENIQNAIERLGLDVSEDKLMAAIVGKVTLSYCRRIGSTLIPTEVLLERSQDLCKELSLDQSNMIDAALKNGTVVHVEGSGYQLLGSALQESGVAHFLRRCADRGCVHNNTSLFMWEFDLNEEQVSQALSNFEGTLSFSLTDEQRSAVKGVVMSEVAMISGGAGTGKTTILNAVLSVYGEVSEAFPMFQLAISGRAAQRMAQSTGRESMTIAKFLANYGGKEPKQPMPQHLLLVIDEASMLDLLSAYRLSCVLPEATRIIFVGDVAQLPPVGGGLVFHACMESSLPHFHLSEVKRQGQQSGIHRLATGIRNNTFSDDLLSSHSGDVDYISTTDEMTIIEAYNWMGGEDDSILLSPTRLGNLGVQHINKFIQSLKDEKRPRLHYQDEEWGWITWRTASDLTLHLNDRVMITQNDYDADIRNGDIGTIVEVYNQTQDGALGRLELNGRLIPITFEVLQKLDLGYAITIHKSQGSQWENCILLLPSYANRMCDQTLLYTAVTRPTDRLMILGDKSLINKAIKRGSSINERQTNLLNRLSKESVRAESDA